ncbi:MAG: hypothetical protein M3N21_08110 [Actinomycetota bacterium]|nr:hypothetical protein [Actinomycetota bacterium]
MSRRAAVLGLAVVAAATALAAPTAARPPLVTLGPAVRIQTPGQTVMTCPIEGEPAVAVTSAGTWVGYNDDQGCPLNPTAHLHLTSLQLVPAAGGAPRYVPVAAAAGGYLSGDPALAPDPVHPGSVLLAGLEAMASGDIDVTVYRVSPGLTWTRLPGPHVSGTFDDKEFMASDLSRRSRWRGRTYLAWDQTSGTKPGVIVRAFDGRAWLPPVRVFDSSGFPDIAVAPDGTVAVAWVGADGSYVSLSHDGGATFGKGVRALTGGEPGRLDPACPLRPTVGIRQRVLAEPRLAWDARNVLHVVTSLAPVTAVSSLAGRTPGSAGVGGTGVIWHTTTRDGQAFSAQVPVAAESPTVQFDPAVAATPAGGVAVEWLSTSPDPQTTYDAFLAVLSPGGRAFSGPVRLSESPSTFPSAMEAVGNSDCYGIGDYTGLAPTATGVTAVWPTSEHVATPQIDTDVLMRPATVR